MTHKRIDVFVKFKSNFHRMISEEQKLVLTFLFFDPAQIFQLLLIYTVSLCVCMPMSA